MPYKNLHSPKSLESRRKASKKYHQDHREKYLAYNAEYRTRPEVRERNRRLQKERNLRGYYSLSLADYEAMLSRQGGKCAACQTDGWGKSGPVVDHDHKTGIVRGLLCNTCNVAAGMLGDNPDRARKLALYLEIRP
jgi:hypothetical protein